MNIPSFTHFKIYYITSKSLAIRYWISVPCWYHCFALLCFNILFVDFQSIVLYSLILKLLYLISLSLIFSHISRQQQRYRCGGQTFGQSRKKKKANWKSNIKTYTLPYVKFDILLYDAGSSNLVLCDNQEGWDGVESGREFQELGDVCIPIDDSFWYMAELSHMFLVSI